MLNSIVDSRDVKFVLFELLNADGLTEYPRFSSLDHETFEAVLDLAEKISIEVIYPTADEGDRIGARWDPVTKMVFIPECFHKAIDQFYQEGLMGLYDDPEYGGAGLPSMVSMASLEFVLAANYCLFVYTGLAHGAMELIEEFGTEEQKKLFIGPMMSGKWGGTMCLTESDAGSDIGSLKTKAIRQPDGSFKIQGQKIFISSGENDYYENIVHCVLARIEGDPQGTAGISLFIVPKLRIDSNGTVTGSNDVVCTGIEHKMGLHAQGTCQLAFGDNGDCIGHLLGGERQGMKIMFKMMNFARMGTALQGQANASAAYMHAVTYAKNRVQGVEPTQLLNPAAKPVPIIKHPDVKRMLLWMKSHIEGQRILIYLLYNQFDIIRVAGDEESRKEAQALIEILTPICKAGCTDRGVEITSMAMQVFGGYGYCRDNPMVRYMCDSKILAIWEGTNGIQSMDLLMRKILLNKDQYDYSVMRKRMDETMSKARGIVDDRYVDLFEKGIKELDDLVDMMKGNLATGKILSLFAYATPFQEAMYMVAIAWCHLRSLTVTLPKMHQIAGKISGAERDSLLEDNAEAAFYSGKVLASQFYLGSEFPKFFGKAMAIKINDGATVKAGGSIFTGATLE